jgi:hypothetical protein
MGSGGEGRGWAHQHEYTPTSRRVKKQNCHLSWQGGCAVDGGVPSYERAVAIVRAQLDEATFAAAWAAGRTMTLEQAIAYALELGVSDTAEPVSAASSPQ